MNFMAALATNKRAVLLGLILLSLVARGALLRRNLWQLTVDRDDYLSLSQCLALSGTMEFGGQPTAYRPPLYPLVLACAYWLQGLFGAPWGWRVTAIAAVHLCLGAGTTVLTYRVAERWQLKQWSLVAAVLVALDPLLAYNARLPMTETLAAFLLVASIERISAERAGVRAAIVAGVVLGLGMLTRTTLWSFTGLAIVAAALSREADRRRRWQWATAVAATTLAVQVPWAVRNWIQLGTPVFTTTHGGYTLLLGNNDVFYDEVLRKSRGAWPQSSLEAWQAKLNDAAAAAGVTTEVEKDAFCYRQAAATIATRPSDFSRSVAFRLMSLWGVAPKSTAEYGLMIRLACAMFYVPELLIMVVGLCDRRVRQWPFNLLPAALVAFTLVHLAYWTDLRMRAPIMPAVAILAAIGASRVFGRFLRPATGGRHDADLADHASSDQAGGPTAA